ncbi:MAG: polysaccharide biosynthesis/export family protein, partial [Pseudomonadota bacterium]
NLLVHAQHRIYRVMTLCEGRMRRYLSFTMLLLGAAFVWACSTSGPPVSSEPLPIPDATSSITKSDLRIGPMDSLQIDVFGVSSLQGTYQVDFRGNLKLPLIDEVRGLGLTASELSYMLEEVYGEKYLQDPDVNVTIVESVGRNVTVDGSINSPGIYPIEGRLTLLQAVAQAGGPSKGANTRKVAVFRQVNGERFAAAFNLDAIREGNADDPEIYGNDIIVVDGSNVSESYGELLRSLPLIALFMAF